MLICNFVILFLFGFGFLSSFCAFSIPAESAVHLTCPFFSEAGPVFIFQMKFTQTEMEAVQPIQRPDASSDVTLVSGDANVCKHFKFGFCKFGEKCKKQHLKEICQTEDCNLKTCNKRHPKICKFFSLYISYHITATFLSRSPHYMQQFSP